MFPPLMPRSRPPKLDENWSVYIVVIAVLFLISVFLFYFYTAR